eukprot:sb/3461524/
MFNALCQNHHFSNINYFIKHLKPPLMSYSVLVSHSLDDDYGGLSLNKGVVVVVVLAAQEKVCQSTMGGSDSQETVRDSVISNSSTSSIIGTSKQPIRTRYLGHVTGYQPIRDQYFLIRSVPVLGIPIITQEKVCQSTMGGSDSQETVRDSVISNSSTSSIIGTSKQPIRTRYLGHVTGYQPIRDQYFLIRSVPVLGIPIITHCPINHLPPTPSGRFIMLGCLSGVVNTCSVANDSSGERDREKGESERASMQQEREKEIHDFKKQGECAKNIPRWQRKKMQQALVQTQLPAGFNNKRRTSSTISKDEAILLGVTMSQIVTNSAIGEETESDLDETRGSTWRDSGIDTNSSTVTSFNPSLSDDDDEDYRQHHRPLSPLHSTGYNDSGGEGYDAALSSEDLITRMTLGDVENCVISLTTQSCVDKRDNTTGLCHHCTVRDITTPGVKDTMQLCRVKWWWGNFVLLHLLDPSLSHSLLSLSLSLSLSPSLSPSPLTHLNDRTGVFKTDRNRTNSLGCQEVMTRHHGDSGDGCHGDSDGDDDDEIDRMIRNHDDSEIVNNHGDSDRGDSVSNHGDSDRGDINSNHVNSDRCDIISNHGDSDRGDIISNHGDSDQGDIVSNHGNSDRGDIIIYHGDSDQGDIVSNHGDSDQGDIVSNHGDSDRGDIVSNHGDSDQGDIISNHGDSDRGDIVSTHGDSDQGDIVSNHGDSDQGDSNHGDVSTDLPQCSSFSSYQTSISHDSSSSFPRLALSSCGSTTMEDLNKILNSIGDPEEELVTFRSPTLPDLIINRSLSDVTSSSVRRQSTQSGLESDIDERRSSCFSDGDQSEGPVTYLLTPTNKRASISSLDEGITPTPYQSTFKRAPSFTNRTRPPSLKTDKKKSPAPTIERASSFLAASLISMPSLEITAPSRRDSGYPSSWRLSLGDSDPGSEASSARRRKSRAVPGVDPLLFPRRKNSILTPNSQFTTSESDDGLYDDTGSSEDDYWSDLDQESKTAAQTLFFMAYERKRRLSTIPLNAAEISSTSRSFRRSIDHRYGGIPP